MPEKISDTPDLSLRKRTYKIIFESDSPAGKSFDVLLIIAIIISVATVLFDSIENVNASIGNRLLKIEWFLTGLFSLEYLLRIYSAPRRFRYARSFFGVVDLISIVPTYLSILIPGSQYLTVVRVLRVLRVFRVLKLAKYVAETELILSALKSSGRKITVFLLGVLTIVVIVGSMIYLIEGSSSGFSSIPKSIYWAIVTLTTVGYGDLSPRTPLGQAIAATIMILGYGLIAVPTALVSMELSQVIDRRQKRLCPKCQFAETDPKAKFCRRCSAIFS